MIVWLASYPRSGNTFLRIALNRLYGVRSSVIYDFDGVATRLGEAYVGFAPRTMLLADMRNDPGLFFIKTHRQRDEIVSVEDRAICPVRDGRDALVSFARLRSEQKPETYPAALIDLILERSDRGTGGWGRNVLSWLKAPYPRTALMTFDALVAHPRDSIEAASASLGLELSSIDDELPDFAELQAADAKFFRKGYSRTYLTEMPDEAQEWFWSEPETAQAMALAGFAR